MRVLFINRMAVMVRGGGETFDIEIARHLEYLGVTVSFLCGIPMFGQPTGALPFERAELLRTPYTGWFPWDRVRGGWRLRLADFWIFENRAAAWAASRQDQFDIIQVCELPTFVRVWKRRGCRPPVVMRLTAPDYTDEGGGIHQADAVIASGTSMEKLRSGIRPDAYDIPNGVDTDRFRPHASSLRSQLGIPGDAFVILFVARFQGVKNHAMLVRAFARLLVREPRGHLILVGSGPLEPSIRRQCAHAGVAQKVRFMGEVPFGDLPDVYAAADIKVISSDYESFCFVALEAMASALPLVVTDTAWVPGLIGCDRGGRVVPINDDVAMAAALAELAAAPDVRESMGVWNRERVKKDYGWAASAGKLKMVYEELQFGVSDAALA